jgi:hypothetical protein
LRRPQVQPGRSLGRRSRTPGQSLLHVPDLGHVPQDSACNSGLPPSSFPDCLVTEDTEARDALRDAGEALKSTLGYSPIRDCSLLAGIRLLFDHQRVLELGTSFNTLRDWQKAAPEIVRFTVDRMGELAYVKFLKPAALPAHVST